MSVPHAAPYRGALTGLRRSGVLREVDHAFAMLLLRMGGDEAVALAGALAMHAVALGHGGFALEDPGMLVDRNDFTISLPDPAPWRDALIASPLVANSPMSAAPLVMEHGMVALRRYARLEQRLADALAARSAYVATHDIDAAAMARLFSLVPGHLDHQALAAWVVSQQRLTLVTGGPGTGKTTTVARMLALLVGTHNGDATSLRIALAAPTGRAAARMGEAMAAVLARDVAAGRLDAATAARVPCNVQTVHRLLGWRRGRVGFRHDAQWPLPFDVVVVDEASMIDLPLMSRLVDAVAPDARLVLLGDPDQLPAVEAGDVLGALCQAAGDGVSLPAALANRASMALGARVAADDRVAPLAGHRVHLQRGYRQAGAVGLNGLARALQAGDIDTVVTMLSTDTPGVHLHPNDTPSLERALAAHVLPLYRAVQEEADPAHALALASRVRVLTGLRLGPWGARAWNGWFAQQLGGAQAWFDGRLVMVTANSYQHGLFNGDTGVCRIDNGGQPSVWFAQGGRLRSWRPGQLPPHEGAFAMTVHKAQGSEFDEVWLLLPQRDARVLSRELLYTAMTRARSRLHVCTGESVLRAALQRHEQRISGLAQRLNAQMPTSST
ncbi:exodeoxyribonuclease V subunit alpha [soil metagenome]